MLCGETFLLAAAMYVDDTDLLHWGDSPITKDEDMIHQVQCATNDFGSLVQATEGALKPTKCFAYFLSYHSVKGKMVLKTLTDLTEPTEWVESKNNDGKLSREPSHISVPQPSGVSVPVPTKDVSDPTLMVGVHYVPRGNGIYHIDAMKNKGDL